MKKIVNGENIVKSYGEGSEKRNVLDGVSVQINEGAFVSIMGPSGSGKSTLLFALSGMDNIDKGSVFFNRRDLSSLGENERADLRRTKMGFVFQQPAMLKTLNILDNIILPSTYNKQKNIAAITKKAKILMEKTGIKELEKRNITQVSGGQLQRAGICRALMAGPEIIFADEPTGALNSVSAREIMDIFSQINAEGTAILLLTHDAKIAARTERILFMHDGNIAGEMQLLKFQGTNLDSRIKKVTEKMQEAGI